MKVTIEKIEADDLSKFGLNYWVTAKAEDGMRLISLPEFATDPNMGDFLLGVGEVALGEIERKTGQGD